MKPVYDAIIIGGGHNGLVTAAYLAKAGHRVLVLEKREVLGGATATEEVFLGFRFAPGSQSTGWLLPAVVHDLQLARYGLEVIRPDPTVFAPLPDGRGLTLWKDPAQTAAEIRKHSPRDAEKWGEFTALLARLAGFLGATYSVTPPEVVTAGLSDLLGLLPLAAPFRKLGRKNLPELLRVLPMPVADWLDEWFESDLLKGVLGASGITGIFQGPRASGTAFVLLHHHVGLGAGQVRSAGLGRGGIGQLARALADSARAYGAEIRTGAEVAQVWVKGGQARGVVLARGGEEISAHRVISNADPRRTFLNLVDPAYLDPEFVRAIKNIKFRGATARVNMALAELPKFNGAPEAGAHLNGVISISPSLDYLERAYDDAKYGGISRQPYLEAVIPTLSDPSLAPAGRHILSALVQYAPYRLKEGAWDDARREALGGLVIDTLAQYAPNLRSSVIHRQVLTPLDLEREYSLTEGNLYHGEMTLDQILFMRPVPRWGQYRTPIRGLYLCGAGTHPGGGVTGAPGYNAAREILRDA